LVRLQSYLERSESRVRQLLEIEPKFQKKIPLEVQASSDPDFPSFQTKFNRIQELARRSRGEIAEPDQLQEILGDSRMFRRARILQEGFLRNFFQQNDDGKKTLQPSVYVTAFSAALFAALFRLWWNHQKEKEDFNTWYPRPRTDLEEQMFTSRPNQWRDAHVDPEEVREWISFLVDHPKMKIRDVDGSEIKNAPQLFEDALWIARIQARNLSAFRVLLRKHGVPDMVWETMEPKIDALFSLGRKREQELTRLLSLEIEDALEGNFRVKDIFRTYARRLLLTSKFQALETSYVDQLQRFAREVINSVPIAMREEGVENRGGEFSLPMLTTALKIKAHRRSEERALVGLTHAPSVFRGWGMANRRMPDGSDLRRGIPGASVSRAALRTSCRSVLSRISMNLGWTLSFAGLGYGASKLLFLPDPEAEMKSEDLKLKVITLRHRLIEGSEEKHQLYAARLKNEIEGWASAENLEVAFSEMTPPNPETGLGSQIYALVLPKLSEGVRARTAGIGILIRYLLTAEGENPELARRFGLEPDMVPEKIYWKYDCQTLLKEDDVNRLIGLVRAGVNLRIDLDAAKEAMTGAY
jgi:hypothetical protein